MRTKGECRAHGRRKHDRIDATDADHAPTPCRNRHSRIEGLGIYCDGGDHGPHMWTAICLPPGNLGPDERRYRGSGLLDPGLPEEE